MARQNCGTGSPFGKRCPEFPSDALPFVYEYTACGVHSYLRRLWHSGRWVDCCGVRNWEAHGLLFPISFFAHDPINCCRQRCHHVCDFQDQALSRAFASKVAAAEEVRDAELSRLKGLARVERERLIKEELGIPGFEKALQRNIGCSHTRTKAWGDKYGSGLR